MARDKICGIYQIVNDVNGKMYIGQSIDIFTRWITHKWELNANTHHNTHLQSAWNKHGEDNFSFNILEECPVELLDDRECYYIEKFNTTDSNTGYNLVSGGSCNRTFSQEVLEKMSKSQTGRKHSEETKQKIRKSHLGKILSDETITKLKESHKKENLSQETINKMSIAKKGKPLTDDHKKKLSNAHKNRVVTEETRKKMSKANIGHIVSDETREKLRKARLGKSLSEESKEKVRKSRIKKVVIQFDLENNFICEYESISFAEKETNTPGTHISACCKGKRKTANGFIWRYKNDYINTLAS